MPTTLSASPNPVVIPLSTSSTLGKTRVRFDHNSPNVFFGEDRDGTGFHVLALNDDQRSKKAFDVINLTPGLVVRIAMFAGKPRSSGRPIEEEPLATVFIFALVDGRKDLVNHEVFVAGGTFAKWTVPTAGEETWAVMQVGSRPVLTDVNGLMSIDEPLRQVISEPAKLHVVETEPLAPGQFFSAVIRVSNSAGFWQCLQLTFNTKKRKVEGEITKIIVDNCGDGEVGEAGFYVHLIEFGTSGAESVVQQWGLGGDEFEVRNAQEIDLSEIGEEWNFSVGPKIIVPEINAYMSLRVHGIEYDGIESDETATSGLGNNKFLMPTGSASETVINQLAEEKGVNNTGGPTPFAFRVKFNFSVTYV